MLQKIIGEIQNQVYGRWQMWDSSWQLHKIGNSFGQVTVQTTYLLFLLMKLAKNCYLFCANLIILMNSELTRKNLVMSNKLTFAIIIMVYSNIILNLSISSCYLVNHTCDFKSKLAVCARSILKSCIWFWTKLHWVQFYHYICASVFYYQFLILYSDHCPNMS